jgi:hypothetical protein
MQTHLRLVNAYLKLICEALSWQYWTLRNANRAVHGVGAILVDAMPMQACGLVHKGVMSCDPYSIAQLGSHCRIWPLSIDAYDWPSVSSVGISVDPVNGPVVLNNSTLC